MTKAADLRNKAVGELRSFLTESRRKLFKLRLVKASGELTQTHAIRATRRDIARAEMILTEKEGKRNE